MDYKIHTHATYATCDAADAFEAAPAYTEKLAANKQAQLKSVNRFFFTHNVSGDVRWAACARPPLQVGAAISVWATSLRPPSFGAVACVSVNSVACAAC